MDFAVEKEALDGVFVLRPRGEIDVYTAPHLKEEIVSAMDAGNKQLIVDLSQVGFMDSSGLGVLVSALKRTKDVGGALRLVCSDDRILKIFRITGLTKVFSIDGGLDEAVRAIGTA